MSTCVVTTTTTTVLNDPPQPPVVDATPPSATARHDGGGGGHEEKKTTTPSNHGSNTSGSKHINKLHRRLSRCPSTTLSDLIPAATAALREQQAAEDTSAETTPLARALTKVKLQIQSKRLKERYLGHEWIRLALDLPVDECMINNPKCAPEPRIIVKPRLPDELPPPSAMDNPEAAATRTIALKKLSRRTGEIVAWYEWKFDKSKFTVEEIQSKVDRLRQIKIEYAAASSPTTTTTSPSLSLRRHRANSSAAATSKTSTTTTSPSRSLRRQRATSSAAAVALTTIVETQSSPSNE
ncbi:hypothetical protein O0I10_003825 [Lichtheimia ornata]|uniref:Uncharacterized protein n=1 Tax=Lichtheimia ornata TaxID=688661 RepID=A0AAD7Y0Y7_9FUNG|nr:uncharacterized protein O0I10_003825 [Lichtheimia ornata]KAJ8660368.1 hypothetical protein O0I10_003825 [Lichtheimia ornata]